MDHSVKAMSYGGGRGAWFWKLLNPGRFSTPELEALFQAYACKLQTVSVVLALGLLAILTGGLSIIILSWWGAPTPVVVYYALSCTVFAGIIAYIYSQWMKDHQLMYICYIILGFSVGFCIISLPMYLGTASGFGVANPADGVWHILFVVFIIYTLLPLRLWVAFLVGIFLPVVHMTVTALLVKDFLSLRLHQVSQIYIHPTINYTGQQKKCQTLKISYFPNFGARIPNLTIIFKSIEPILQCCQFCGCSFENYIFEIFKKN